jgi:ribonuclease G
VQITKDPIGSKGARLTTEISIPSRYQVYMPYAIKGGVSQRIEHEPEPIIPEKLPLMVSIKVLAKP